VRRIDIRTFMAVLSLLRADVAEINVALELVLCFATPRRSFPYQTFAQPRNRFFKCEARRAANPFVVMEAAIKWRNLHPRNGAAQVITKRKSDL
jgi:hypothetical protein